MTKKRKRYFRKASNWPSKYHNDDIIHDLEGAPTYREACNRLRKSWKKFKIGKWNDDELTMEEASTVINQIQVALRIPLTNFATYKAKERAKEDIYETTEEYETGELDDEGNQDNEDNEDDTDEMSDLWVRDETT